MSYEFDLFHYLSKLERSYGYTKRECPKLENPFFGLKSQNIFETEGELGHENRCLLGLLR